MRRTVAAALLTSVIACSATAQALRVIASSGQSPPASPAGASFTFFTGVYVAPNGRVAFGATGSDASQTYRNGVYAERSNGLVRVADNLSLGVPQDFVPPHPINSAGDVLYVARLPGNAQAWRLNTSSNADIDLVRTGDTFPVVTDRLIAGTVIDPIGLVPPRRLTDSRAALAYCSLTPAQSPTGSTFAGILAINSNGSRDAVALVGSSTTWQLPLFSSLGWPLDLNESGHAVFLGDPAGAAPLGAYYWNGEELVRLLQLGDNIPGVSPPVPVNLILDVRINDAGEVLLVVGGNPGGMRFLLGPPNDLRLVLSANDVLGGGSQQIRVAPNPFVVPFYSLGNDGTAYVFTRALGIAPTFGVYDCVIKLSRTASPEIRWHSGEPVRMPDGTLRQLVTLPDQTAIITSLGTGRLAWRADLATQRGTHVICMLNDDGDPVAVITGGSEINLPSGARLLNPTLMNNFTQFGDFSKHVNDAGDLVIATTLVGSPAASVIVAANAPEFPCGDIDFNNNAVFPEDQDVIDFFNVLAGSPCPTLRCDTLDFNRNGTFPEDQDVIDFLTVLAGGSCS